MKKKLLPGLIGGFIGFVAGVIGGGYLGLVVGGTFLGGFEIHKYTGLEGYELAAYIGAVIGALAMAITGAKIAWRMAEKKGKEL